VREVLQKYDVRFHSTTNMDELVDLIAQTSH